jgi:hypothetical protein
VPWHNTKANTLPPYLCYKYYEEPLGDFGYFDVQNNLQLDKRRKEHWQLNLLILKSTFTFLLCNEKVS